MDRPTANDLWTRLAEEGKAPTDPHLVSSALASYTVGITPWLDRLRKTYFRDLCRRSAHSKLVLAEYGGGKTHFLMSLATSAHAENFAYAYLACAQGTGLDSPFDIYREVVKMVSLPGQEKPGLQVLLKQVVAQKRAQIAAASPPDTEFAMDAWLDSVATDDFPETSFGRVIVEALKGFIDSEGAANRDAALRWLRGEDGLTREELASLCLGRVAKSRQDEYGRNMLLSLLRFIPEAGVHGTVLLFDEVETLFNASGKALERLLGAMRVLIDVLAGTPGGLPAMAAFAAVPQVLEKMHRYPALSQRLAVLGSTFHEGNDRAPQIDLAHLGSDEAMLIGLGIKLMPIGEIALECKFSPKTQEQNLKTLAEVALSRNLEVDRRRLFIKTWTNLLGLQAQTGERVLPEEEVRSRYSGAFDALRQIEQQGGGKEP